MKKLSYSLLFIALICCSSNSWAQSCLKAYFPFDGNSKEVIGGYNGTVHGAVLDTDRNGALDSAYSFNGSSDYISSSYPVPTGNSARSVTAWFNTKDSTTNAGYGYNTIVSWGYPSSNNMFSIATAQHGAIRIDGFANDVRTTKYVTDGFWHFIAVTHDGDTTRVYIDDTLIAKKGTTYNTVSSDLMIGARVSQSGQVMNGKIDEVQIFSCALSDKEIDSLYRLKAHNYTPPVVVVTSCLKAYYPFTGNAGDSVGGYNGTVYGAKLTSDRGGNAYSAYSFNGSSDYISSSYPVPTGNSPRTVTAWFNTSDSTTNAGYGYNTIVSWGDVSANNLFSIATAQHGAIRIDGFTNDVRTTKYVTDGNWHFVAVSHDGDTTRVYVDDTLIAKKGTSYNTVSSNLMIGARINQAGQVMNGKIDDVRIFECAISDKDIDSLYKVSPHGSNIKGLTGKITTCGGANLANNKVYLVKFNPIDTTVSSIDSTMTDSFGNYTFINLTDTLVFVYTSPDSASYPGSLPTYYDSAAAFQDANGISIHSSITTANFQTVCGKNPGGSGFIGGKVTLCALCKKAGSGKPAVGLRMILVDANNVVQAETYTDTNGNFSFNNIAIKNYKVMVDRPLVDNSKAPAVSLTPSTAKQNNLSFTLYPTFLDLATTTGISQNNIDNSVDHVEIFPNPVQEELNIDFKMTSNDRAVIKIFNSLGETVIENKISGTEGNMKLNVSGLRAGIYFMIIQNGNSILKHEKIIHN